MTYPIHKILEKARSIYVVVLERKDPRGQWGYDLLQDPGLNRPWRATNIKLAIKMADDVQREGTNVRKAAAMSIEDAFNFLVKHSSNQQDLIKQLKF